MSGFDVGFDELLNQGMSITTLCNEIAEKIVAVKQKGYDEGYAAGQASGGGGMDTFWDAYFASQKEQAQIGTFGSAGWNEQTFKPDRTINATNLGTGNANSLFGRSGFEVFPAYLSDGVTPILDTSAFSTMGSIFGSCSKLKRIEAVLDLKMCTNMTTAFAGSSTKPCPLEYVKLTNVQKCSNWTNAFNYCPALTDIGQESDDFGYFSASVDLSQTAINFGTPKMSFYNLLTHGNWSSSPDAWLRHGFDRDLTLTISQKQLDDANYYLNEYHHMGTLFDDIVTGGWGWTIAVV